MQICVVALGKIGLPLAVQFAAKGHHVIGADVDGHVVHLVNEGVEPFPGEAGLAERLKSVVAEGRLLATTDTTAAVMRAEAVVLVVPVYVDARGTPTSAGWIQRRRLWHAGCGPAHSCRTRRHCPSVPREGAGRPCSSRAAG